MFSWIIESIGTITAITVEGENKHFTIASSISEAAYIDQSIAHNGVCLTVIEHDTVSHTVIAIKETLQKTNLDHWKVGDLVNLERSVLASSRMDGHFVQGHVDQTALCTQIIVNDGSWTFFFDTDASVANLMVQKGSITINGVSLTVVEASQGKFSVAIIPFTYAHTNFSQIRVGDLVNIEFDILGKYIIQYMKNLHTIL